MNVNEISNEVLAAQVVAYRALGVQKNLAIIAMDKIKKRKNAGDVFDFDSFITSELNKIPKITESNGSISDGLSLIQQLLKNEK